MPTRVEVEAKKKKRSRAKKATSTDAAGPLKRAASTGLKTLRTISEPFTRPFETVAGKAAGVVQNIRAADPDAFTGSLARPSGFESGFESVQPTESVAPEFNDANSKQDITPRSPEPAVAERQTSFTNADAAKFGTQRRRSLAEIPGRDFFGTATFQERLNRFRENNPEFTPRSQRPNKGVTSNAGGVFERELAARNARVGQDDDLDALSRPGRGGSIRGAIEAAKIRSGREKQRSDNRSLGQAPAASAAGPTFSDRLASRRLVEEKQASDQANRRLGNFTELQKLAAGQRSDATKQSLDERKFGIQSSAEVRNTRQSVLDDVYGPTMVDDKQNRQRSEAAQFLDRSSIKSPEDVGEAVQFYRIAKPLAEQQGIATAISPFLARIFDWAKGNSIPMVNQSDVQAAIQSFQSGQGPGGVQLDPDDVSSRNRQIIRSLSTPPR